MNRGAMPKKVRELKAILLKAGFEYESAKGSHTKWSHPLIDGKLTVSGKDGGDAKPYQEKDVQNALKKLAAMQAEEENQDE
jgi:predicted RNA binding protein YcfA (HicA-like mRNA interferase family)